ncbi:MAG: hypothetical protein ICV73_03465 [Acetobacteraceae bacterium]|nr:hypothetical protein [Acetobacteraceae bacterium]
MRPVPAAVPRLAVLLFAALLALGSGACGPNKPPLVVAMEPRPNPPLVRPPPDSPRERLRQNRWLAQFWEELTPAQRRRVEARMRRAKPPMASDKEAASHVWDGLGLAERDRLVFGPAPARPSATASATEAAAPAPAP